jgi:hypothetical protein
MAADLHLTIDGNAPFTPAEFSFIGAADAAELAKQFVAHNLSTTVTHSSFFPVISSPASVSISTTSSTPLSAWFTASEVSEGTTHTIDHYTAFIVRGSGSLLINGQPYALGTVATNISGASFATATFNAGPGAGVSEIAVIAFDDS